MEIDNNKGTLTNFRREGDPAFPVRTETDNSADPSSEKTNSGNPAHEGDNTRAGNNNEPNVPFHQHPRWKEREEDWKRREKEWEARHNALAQRFDSEMEKVRNASQKQREEHTEEIPNWFGGDADQWKAYKAHEETRIAQAEQRAIEKIRGQEAEEKRKVQEANEHFETSIKALEDESGMTVDKNKLLKITLDNQLVDPQGRWNYRAAFQIYRATEAPKAPTPSPEKKKLADATLSENRGGTDRNERGFKTSEDFKVRKPW